MNLLLQRFIQPSGVSYRNSIRMVGKSFLSAAIFLTLLSSLYVVSSILAAPHKARADFFCTDGSTRSSFPGLAGDENFVVGTKGNSSSGSPGVGNECSGGNLQKLPAGYALSAIGFASDDEDCWLFIRTAPINPDGSIDFSRSRYQPGKQCPTGRANNSEVTVNWYNYNLQPNKYVTGWTWGANTGGTRGGSEECYYQEYTDLRTKQVYDWYNDPLGKNGTCDERGMGNPSNLNNIYRAPAGEVIIGLGMTLASDADLDSLWATMRDGTVPVGPSADIKVNGLDGPVSLAYNGTANVTWSSTNADICNVTPGNWSGPAGAQSQQLTNSVVYTLDCRNSSTGATASDSVTVTVDPEPSFTLSVTPGWKALLQGQSFDFTVKATCTGTSLTSVDIDTVTFTAGSSGLSYAYPAGFTKNIPCGGSTMVTLSASNSAGPLSQDTPNQITATFQASSGSITGTGSSVLEIYAQPTLSLTAIPNGGQHVDDQVLIQWTPKNTRAPNQCNASGSWSGPKGSVSDTPYQDLQPNFPTATTYTYTLQCDGFLGTSVTQSVSVDVAAIVPGTLKVDTVGLPAGQNPSVTYSITGPTNVASATYASFPQTHSVNPGSYDLTISSVTPPAGFVLDSPALTPGITQTVTSGATTTYTLHFKAQPATPDFTIMVTPQTPTTILAGGSVTYRVDITNCNAQVTQSVSGFTYPGLPGGVTTSALGPILCNDAENVTISTPTSLVPGNKPFSVSGSANGVTKQGSASFTIAPLPTVTLNASSPVAIGSASTLTWSSQNTTSCELFGDGRPSLEVNSEYGHIVAADGTWSAAGAPWSVFNGNSGLPGSTPVHDWTKEAVVGGTNEQVHFGVTDKSSPPFTIGHGAYNAASNTNQHAWFLENESPYWTVDIGSTAANGYILWSLYKDGTTTGEPANIGGYIEDDADYQGYGVKLDASGKWAGFGGPWSSNYIDASGKVTHYTRQAKIVKDPNPAKRNDPANIVGLYHVNFTVSKYKPLFTMDRAVYTLSQTPVYTVTGGKPGTLIHWNSFFNNLSMNNQAPSGSGSTGNLNIPEVYQYTMVCQGQLGTSAKASTLVRATPQPAIVHVNYSIDGAIKESPSTSVSYTVVHVTAGNTPGSGTTAPNNFTLNPGQINVQVTSSAPAGYTFAAEKVTPQNFPLTLTPNGQITFTINLVSAAAGGGFNISVSPNLLFVSQGYKGVFAVDVEKVGPDIGQLQVSVTNQSTGNPITTPSPIEFCLTRPGIGTYCSANQTIADNSHRNPGGKVELKIPTDTTTLLAKYDVQVSIKNVSTGVVTKANLVTLQVNPDFVISVTPPSQQASPGATATYAVDVTKMGPDIGVLAVQIFNKANGGPLQTVSPPQFCITRNGIPPACSANAMIADNSHRSPPDGKVELKIPVAANVSLGDYTVIVSIHNTNTNVSTQASPVTLLVIPYFTISLSPSSVTVNKGDIATYSVDVTKVGGSIGQLQVAVVNASTGTPLIAGGPLEFCVTRPGLGTNCSANQTIADNSHRNPGGKVELQIPTANNTVKTTYTVKASIKDSASGFLTDANVVSLVVTAAPCPGSPGVITMTPATINAGDQATLSTSAAYSNVVFSLDPASNSSLATISSGPGKIVAQAGGNVTVNATGDAGAATGCSLQPLSVQIKDFSISASANPTNFQKPSTTSSVTVTVSPVNGGSMGLDVRVPSALPSGWVLSPATKAAVPGDVFVMTVTVPAAGATGTFSLPFTGTYVGNSFSRSQVSPVAITVTDPPPVGGVVTPTKLIITPHIANLNVSDKQDYIAKADFSNGTTNVDVTANTTFITDDSSIASFVGKTAKALANGTTLVTATFTDPATSASIQDTTSPKIIVGGGGGSGGPLPPVSPISTDNSSCSKITIQWNPDPASPPYTDFKIYRRNNTTDPWGSAIATVPAATHSYTDSTVVSGPLYYYGVTAYNSANSLESTQAKPQPEGIAASACAFSFSGTDKEIKDINGTVNTRADLSSPPNGKFEGIDSSFGLIQLGSTLTMVIRLYNSGTADLPSNVSNPGQIYIIDTLQNLNLSVDPPDLFTVACLQRGAGPISPCRATPDLSATTGASPNKSYKFYIRGGGLKPGQYYQLTYTVKVPTTTGDLIAPKIKNTVELWYDAANTGSYSKQLTVPFFPLLLDQKLYVPNKKEIAP